MKTKGHIHGYASLFGVKDLHQDFVIQGAFQKSLRAWRFHKSWPKMLWQHQVSTPIGVWQDMKEDAKGLFVKGQLNLNTQQGREAYALLQQGAIGELSIGFRTVVARRHPTLKHRELLDVELLEISLVTFAANRQARVSIH